LDLVAGLALVMASSVDFMAGSLAVPDVLVLADAGFAATNY